MAIRISEAGYWSGLVAATATATYGLVQVLQVAGLLQFPADEIAALLDAEAEKEEKVLPRVLTFVVNPQQEELIERAVEMASDGTAGRDRKARGLTNLAKTFLEDRSDEEGAGAQ